MVFQFRLDQCEDAVCPGDDFLDAEIGAEDCDQTSGTRPVGDLARGDREPFLYPRRGQGLFRQPVGAAVFARQIDKDGRGIGNDHTIVVEYRHLAEGIELQKVRGLVSACRHVDLDQFIGHAKQ